jgi:hypothetical protein
LSTEQLASGSSGNGGIETPAFGKKKTPSLAYFKGESTSIDLVESKKKNGDLAKVNGKKDQPDASGVKLQNN